MDRREDNLTSFLSLFLSFLFKDFFFSKLLSPRNNSLFLFPNLFVSRDFHFPQDESDHFFIISLNSRIISKNLKRSERMKVNEEKWTERKII